MRIKDRFICRSGFWVVSLICAFSLIIFYRNLIILDPDFGWLTRMGQIILADGLPHKDPFSYTMSNYVFIAHEWLSEVFLAVLYPAIGIGGLALLFTSIIIITLIINISLVPKDIHRWMLVPLFLSLCLITDFASIRIQVFSWLFFTILIKTLFSGAKFKKRIILVSTILLIWVNMHGSFALGTGIAVLYSLIRIFEKKKNYFQETVILAVSVLVTLINPYGPRIWEESFMTISDRYLRKYIIEWQPAIFLADFLFWILVAFSCFFVIRYRKKHNISELAIFCVLCILSLTGMKQIPFFVLFSMPLLTKGLGWLREEAGRVKFGNIRFNKLYKGLVILVLFMYIPYLIYFLFRIPSFSEKASYPVEAVKFLDKYYPSGRMFTLYHLNGYINWKLPGYKVFINGMMPIWKSHNFKNESSYAFREYRDIMSGEISFVETSRRYSIDTLILPAEEKKDEYAKLREEAVLAGMKIIYNKKGVVVYRINIR